ncbi:hypothetical protein IIA15_06570 [candidate division TA06 bacterium]|nr:hypothetical protein [candidate division TA06 bacterium]
MKRVVPPLAEAVAIRLSSWQAVGGKGGKNEEKCFSLRGASPLHRGLWKGGA